MSGYDDEERFIVSQIEALKEQYLKACEPWVKRLLTIRNRHTSVQVIINDAMYQKAKEGL